jgi:hypothetical protein
MSEVDQQRTYRPQESTLGRSRPGALGLLLAGALLVAAWSGHVSWRQLTAVLAAAALAYLGSAALGSGRAAWWLFAGTVVLIALDGRLAVVDPLAGLAVCAVLLLVVGIVRRGDDGRWGLPAQVAAQVAAMAVVLGVAYLAVTVAQPWAAVLLAVGLLAHTGWDLHHRRTGRVVPRSMAEFCAVLDAVLAAGVVALALI